ncbi:hypothetical protein SLT67_14470 [Paenibacillus illinoisensis]|uniref:hypothetical protein n=1 Tax=Paenibacillus illinoisensis TaxID=59845 RepID=UPI003CF09273
MLKIKKIVPAVALSVAVLSGSVVIPNSVNANPVETVTANENDIQHVQLNKLFVDIPYSDVDYELKRKETTSAVEIEVYERSTGNLVTTYGEVKNQDSNFSTRAATDYQSIRAYQDYQDSGFVSVRLQADLYVYNSGSFGQINKVISTNYYATSDGSWDMVNANAHTVSLTGSFPTQQVQVKGSVTIDTVKTKSGGVALGDLGYTVQQNSHYRKNLNHGFTFSYGR